MRYINIDLSSDNHLQQPQIFGGYAGEHNETVLQVKLPQRMIGVEYSDYRFDFQTSEDNEIPIPVSKLDNGILSCHLTEQVTVAGKLLFNVIARKLDGHVVSLTSKTNMVNLYIGDSPYGNNVLPDPTGYKDEILEMIDKRIQQINPAQVNQTYSPKSPNAQSGTAVAEAVENKEDKSNKVSDLFVGADELTHEQYPSAKATSEFVNSLGSSLTSSVEEVRNMALSMANDKEDKGNKVSTLKQKFDDDTEYPSALCVQSAIDAATITLRTEAKAIEHEVDALNTVVTMVDAKKEDKGNKVDDLKVPQSELVGKYPSALAVDDLCRTYNVGLQYEISNKADKTYVDEELSGTANAIKETIEGTGVITAKDVSPIEHSVKIKVQMPEAEKLLTRYASCEFGSSAVLDGMTFVVASDGTITTSGVYTGEYGMPFSIADISYAGYIPVVLKRGTKYQLKTLVTPGFTVYTAVYKNGEMYPEEVLTATDEGVDYEITVPDEADYTGNYELSWRLQPSAGVGANGETYTFKPEICEVTSDNPPITVDPTITIFGKNLLSVNEVALTTSSKEFAIERIPAGKYYVSANVSNDGTGTSRYQLCFYTKDNQQAYYTTNFGNGVIELPKDAYYLRLWNITGASNTYWKDMQVEIGDIRTAFEPFKEVGTYTITTNSEIEIPSFSPNMSFISSIPEAKLACEFNRDTNSIVENKMELIGEYIFTGGETSKTIYFTKDKNGNAFKLDEIAVRIDLGSNVAITSSQPYSCYVNGYDISECMFYKSGNGSSARYFQAYAKKCGKDYWFNVGYFNMATATYNGQCYFNYEMSGVDYIYKLKVSMPLIQAGAKVRVYGRRVS